MIPIIHLITGLETGGAERMLARLVAGIDRDRFHNTVVSMTNAGSIGADLAKAGVPTVSLGMSRGVANPMRLMRLVTLLRRHRPAILQTWLYHADLMGITAGRLAKVPNIVWNIRCSDMNMQDYRWMSRPLPRLLAKLSEFPATVVVNSETGRRVHENYGYRPRSWQMIPNGFDVTQFRPDPEMRRRTRAELGVPDDVVLIGLPARLDPMKDHLTFFAAATDLLGKDPNVRFVLIGRGLTDTNPWVTSRVAACGLSNHIHLLGERRDIETLYPALDIVTLSSAFGEGFPNVLGEAMACGVPCASTDAGDAVQIVGDTGVVFEARDPTAMVVAWRKLIQMGPEQRQELGRRAREHIVRDYSLPVIVRRYERLYEEIAGRSARVSEGACDVLHSNG